MEENLTEITLCAVVIDSGCSLNPIKRIDPPQQSPRIASIIPEADPVS